MKIVSLKAENIKRLSAVHIEPNGSLVIIGGKNAQGKTSVLDSIQMALGGKDSVPPEPIRKGAKKGEIVADLDELIVTRRFTSKSTYLSVTTKDGEKPKSPQAILDKLCGTLSFDPLEFSRMKPQQQAEVLRELVGLDFVEHDALRKKMFDERTEVNRTLKALRAQCEGMENYTDAPAEPVDVAKLVKELDRIDKRNALVAEKKDKLRAAKANVGHREAAIADLARQIEEAKAQLAEDIEAVKAAEIDVAGSEPEDRDPVHEDLVNAADTNRQVEANAKRAALIAEVKATAKKADGLTASLDKLDEQKAAAIESAKMPVDKLGLEDDVVTYDGLPLSQASSAEQLRVSVSVGLALNPKLAVLLIRDGSLLDEDSLRALAEMAEKANAQVWIERVGDGDETAVIIEDGEVRDA